MEHLPHATNAELLSALTGKPVAHALLNRFGGLINLAQASFDELGQVRGVGRSKAAAIKSPFLLALQPSRTVAGRVITVVHSVPWSRLSQRLWNPRSSSVW